VKFKSWFFSRPERFRLPVAAFVVICQRTPAVRIAVAAADYVLESPVVATLRSVAASVAVLGTVDSMAGASSSTAILVADINVPATVNAGQSFVMHVGVTGLAVTYAKSWDVSNTLPPGITVQGATLVGNLYVINDATATLGVLTISGVPTKSGTYTFTVDAWQNTNRSGSVTPGSTSITVIGNAGIAPTFVSQPVSQTVNAGATVTFTATTGGTPAPTFQWLKNGVSISGATSSTLTLTNVASTDAGTYAVVATNSTGSATSSNAVLTVNSVTAPTIIAQPLSVTANGGGTVALVVTATSATSYQWRKDGVVISGSTNDTLILANVTSASAGVYTVVATNSNGSVTSNGATLTVTSGQVSRISNLSVRTNLGSGQTLTVGFVTSGSKSMMIRAIGPSLNAVFGLTGFFADPQFTVLNSLGTVVAQNDNWSSAMATTFASLGAFPLTIGSKDAALLLPISGPTTAQINGTGAGVMLVEVYDADSTSAPFRLTNVSARNQVGAGGDILISGFVVDGTAARTLLIRGIGPALHDVFGVNGQLADPVLEIHQTVNGVDTVVASNDNWNAGLASIFSQVGAYQFTNGSKDAALLITLPPGVYTAQVSGVNLGTGDGVVEVYEVP